MDFDGASPTVIVDGLHAAWPVTVDVSTHRIYWGDVNSNLIQRANLDGSSLETVVSGHFSFIDGPAGIAVDPVNQQLYWTDFVVDKIARTDLITLNTVAVVNKPGIPLGIDLDLGGGLMYWANANTERLRRATLNGAGAQDVLTGLDNPRDLKLDIEGGKVYWCELITGIWRANLDGTSVEHLVSQSQANGFHYFALDRLQRKLYWKAYVGLVRTDLDGTNLEIVVPVPHESVLGGTVEGIAIVHDCNENGIDDTDELAVNDCDGNRNPDDCDPDADGDGVTDDCDNCPQTPNTDQHDCSGDSIGDACESDPALADDDSDGTCNGQDLCPLDPQKTEPGTCGCGVPDTDSDNDGVANCIDQCSGSPDIDSDGDQVLDCFDRCPGTPDIDSDGDGVLDCQDRCAGSPDTDSDGDLVLDCSDQCPGTPDLDSDGDTVLDCLDLCPGQDDRTDANGNGMIDCLEPPPIPTVSQWGLVILAVGLAIAAKLRYRALPQAQGASRMQRRHFPISLRS